MNKKLEIESLASDLKRVSLGLQRNSMKMTERFSLEVLKRKQILAGIELDHYIERLLENLENILKSSNNSKKAEDALMYSTLFQNYAATLSP